ASQFVSSYAVLGRTVNGVTTFGEPLLVQAGVSYYSTTEIGGLTARWGDYSAAGGDPPDSFTFLTFQEWVSAENTWSTQITQLKLLRCVECTDFSQEMDFDGDGKADIAVFSNTTGEWLVRRSKDGGPEQVSWGAPTLGDVPVPGDYDGDG